MWAQARALSASESHEGMASLHRVMEGMLSQTRRAGPASDAECALMPAFSALLPPQGLPPGAKTLCREFWALLGGSCWTRPSSLRQGTRFVAPAKGQGLEDLVYALIPASLKRWPKEMCRLQIGGQVFLCQLGCQ